ncbi:MAG: aminotransferase class III-fold pyridoxal phosphate-dependent enzyme [Planctomycetes bacterium]|nr:aminotransferase class III-fold pyridoxal phosphate-dependent enzyme [Planctomycetota bacterium]
MVAPADFRALEEARQLRTYAKYPFAIERGQGAYVFDQEGARYLDFYGGHAVASTGHCHPRVVAAVREQAGRLLFYSNVCYSSVRARAADALLAFLPAYGKAFFSNSGAEANDNALKMARRFTRREEVVSLQGNFHGRTIGALSATGIEKYRAPFPPLVPGHRFVDLGDAAAVRAAVGQRAAAVIVEPIQSTAGVRLAPPAFYQEVRAACDAAGALLIFDEVQTGVGRTGKFLCAEHFGVTPDIVTLAKGVASGIPMGVTLLPERIAATIAIGEHGSTFGGGQVACAAMLATMEVMRDERLSDNAARAGAAIREAVASVPGVKAIRGLGLLLGLELDRPAAPVQQALLAARVLTGTSNDPAVLRLLPPLMIGAGEIAEFAAAFRRVMGHAG